jgi:hypothetical protein
MSYFQRDIVDFPFLDNLLSKGIVNYIEDTSSLFKKIASKFPILQYRIHWDALKHITIKIEEKYPFNKNFITKSVMNIFLQEGFDMGLIVFICFDGYTNGGFSMPLGTFIEKSSEILTTPQHTYVTPEDSSWCMQYSMEDFLEFGYAPDNNVP